MSHFWLLENSGRSLDSVFIEMQHSIDAMLINLVKDEQKLNEVTDYLFDLVEIEVPENLEMLFNQIVEGKTSRVGHFIFINEK
ncbi:MAG: hypothetical protein ACI9XP_000868 [Lentimonas sp.]